jgi:hypothetical protein
MHAATFKKRLHRCADVLEGRTHVYGDKNFWSRSVEPPLEPQLTELADLYWDASADQRRQIRESVGARLSMELFLYIRRVAIMIETRHDVAWLRRGLAIAAIENGHGDYRDTIVSLVILRFAAERVGIKTRKHFNDAIRIAETGVHETLKNARDHRESDVKYTIREFGPPEWRRKRR